MTGPRRSNLLRYGWWLLALCLAGPARAELTIEITGGGADAIPIAVVPFTDRTAAPEQPGSIISADLHRSGRFRPLATGAQPQRPQSAAEVNYAVWRAAGIDNLVIGEVARSGTGYALRFQLFDVVSGERIAGETVNASAKDLRFAAHHIADIIYERLTGERGAFATRIAYVSATRTADGKDKVALNVADSDGFNASSVVRSTHPVLSPSWSPSADRLAYVSFEGGKPAIYVQKLATGQRDKVAGFPGINSAPAWSPDGSRLAMALSKDGNPDIYVMNMATRQVRAVTNSRGADTEPAWSPDGRYIVFTSDRGGQPQIYRVSSGGGSAERLTFEGSYNTRASYAPDGRSLSLVTRVGGQYRIGVLDLETRGLRVLSDGNLDESPSFAPNGAMIIYAATAGGRGTLSALAVDGDIQQRLTSQGGDVREPVWSPFLNYRSQ
ncbi:MAG: Tol-Pal system beta propeller repeat protein TolB [Pseudomonadota bacterium]